MIDIDLYRKLAGSYDVESSENNAVNQFVYQSDKIYSNTLSIYDVLAPSMRGDDIIITDSSFEEKESRGVFNYNKYHTTNTMKIGEERCYLELGDGIYGNYIKQVDTDETFIVAYKDINRFNYDDTVVKKCNVDLKFYDDCGVLQTIKAHIQAEENKKYLSEGKYMTLASGEVSGLMQTNEITSKISIGDEFIFGNLLDFKYRVSYLNDFEFTGATVISLEKYEINSDIDNLELGIANYTERPQFTLSILPTNTEISTGNTVQLEYSLLNKDGQEDDERTISWVSSDESIITIDSNGLVTAVANGNATITASMACNSDVDDFVLFEITETPSDNIEYILTPADESITRTDTIIFEAKKYNNGTEIAETFTFSIDGSTTAEADDYEFEILTNASFSIKNIQEGLSVGILITPDSDVLSAFVRNLDLDGYW